MLAESSGDYKNQAKDFTSLLDTRNLEKRVTTGEMDQTFASWTPDPA